MARFKIRGFKVSANNCWTAEQVRSFIESAIAGIGGVMAWTLLVEKIQRAVLADEVMYVALTNERDVNASNLLALFMDMQRMAGLRDAG